MNSFNITWDDQHNPHSKAAIEINLNPCLQKQWQTLLYQAFPIAMIQGQQIFNTDGSMTLRFVLAYDEANRLSTAILKAVTTYTGFLQTN